MALSFFGKAWRLAFEISPIFLVGGIAENIPGKMLPIALITEGLGLAGGLLHGKINETTCFIPMAGTTLINQDISEYPAFNQDTAANATVQKPNRVMMQMIRPASTGIMNNYAGKPITFTALKMALDMHNKAGGTYTILTPSYIYMGCLLRTLVDSSGFSGENKQVQFSWSFEFEQPLVFVSQLQSVLGNMMSKFEKGVPSPGGVTWSQNGVVPPIPNI
ncbi:hypothetical protein [Citrobacter werkmanii]|uniref:hypothetical protein n=1 Tax=Citrobacter werkmanii TaxID=67827 RepID=UPI00300DB7E1